MKREWFEQYCLFVVAFGVAFLVVAQIKECMG